MSESRIPPESEREMTPAMRAFVEALFLRIDELTAKVNRLERELENLWPFANDPQLQIEPTNNAAERALRHPVIWKQLSFGTQSASGSRLVETLLSVVETCRQQGRDVLQFLHTSLTAKLNGHPGPSLLPNGA